MYIVYMEFILTHVVFYYQVTFEAIGHQNYCMFKSLVQFSLYTT